MFWIVMLVVVNEGLVKAQPTVSPNGTVDVVQGQNLRLTCSYANRLSETNKICRWDEDGNQTGNFIVRLYLVYNDNSKCTTNVGNDSLYGYRCLGNNKYEMTIYNARYEVNHNTLWRCTQYDQDSKLVDSNPVKILVKVGITSVTMSPQPDLISIIEGTSRQFDCLTSFGSPAATVTWYKTGGTLETTVQSITANVTDEMSEQGSRSILQFVPNRNDQDVKIYCTAQNVGISMKSTLQPTVNVLYGPSDLKCTYKYNTVSGPINIIQGNSLMIGCSSNSNPLPNLHQWHFSNGSQSTEQLSLPNIQRSHNGSFIYEVKNSMKASNESVVIGVSEVTITVRVLYPPSTPTFTIGNSRVSGKVKIISGNSKTIHCSSDSNPSSNYTWNPLVGSTSGRDLILTNVQHLTSNGQYTCTARNVMRPTGEVAITEDSSDSITVEVLYPPSLTFHYGNTSGSTVEVTSTIAVVQGEALPVYCVAIANPAPYKYMWGNSEGQTFVLTNLKANTSRTCIATNHMAEESNYQQGNPYGQSLEGSNNKSLHVTVWAPPQKPKIYFAMDCTSYSLLPSLQFDVISGGTFCLECSAESVPSSTFSWSGEKNTSGRVFSVDDVRKDIIANNTCTARNTMVTTFSGNVTRESQTSIFINVLYGPDVGDIKNKSVVRGHNLSVECPFTKGNPSVTFFTWKQDKTGSIKSRIQTLNIPNVQRSDAGTYTCETTNMMRPTGSQARQNGSTGIFHLDVLFGAENIQFKINDDSTTKIEISEKSNVSIACSVESNPASHMIVSRDGSEVVSENDVTSLKFSKQARCEDAGVYVCSGNNLYAGRPSSNITLHVTCSARRLPDFDIKLNVSSALGSNAIFEFRAQAYPLPTGVTWERCTPTCTTIEHGEKFNIYSKDGVQFFLAIGNVTVEDYTQYNFAITNGIGKAWQERFSLIAYDKPQPPTNFRYIPESVTTSSVMLSWLPGFDGGPAQTFVVLFRSKRETTWNMLSINQTSENEMNVSIYSLSPGTLYDTFIFARNEIGNSSTLAVLTFETLVQEIMEPPPSNAALIGGIAGGGTCVVLLAIGALVFFKRKLGEQKPDSTKLTTHHNLEVLEGDSDSEDVVENVMYESAGVIQNNPKSADNLYASPVKKKKTQETGDVYAVVNKKHKMEKPKDKKTKEKKSENDIYENSETAKRSYHNKGFDCHLKHEKLQRKVNDEGLVYADLLFANPPKGQKRLVIHGIDDMTEYAELDLTKKADPLPDCENESTKADK